MRRIKSYKNMSKERLWSALDESESAVSGNDFDNARIKKIRRNFNKLRDRFLQPKIKEIRRKLYEIENKNNLSKSKIKEIEQNLTELEESLFKLNKYYDYNDIEYKGIRDVANLFNGVSTDPDYSRPTKTKTAFNGNYIKCESKGDKDKNLSPREYLNLIRPYLSHTINDHETPKTLRVHSRNEVIHYETQYGQWKTQLTMSINFTSSLDSNESRNMHAKSDNTEIMMGIVKQMILLMNFLNFFCKNIKKD